MTTMLPKAAPTGSVGKELRINYNNLTSIKDSDFNDYTNNILTPYSSLDGLGGTVSSDSYLYYGWSKLMCLMDKVVKKRDSIDNWYTNYLENIKLIEEALPDNVVEIQEIETATFFQDHSTPVVSFIDNETYVNNNSEEEIESGSIRGGKGGGSTGGGSNPTTTTTTNKPGYTSGGGSTPTTTRTTTSNDGYTSGGGSKPTTTRTTTSNDGYTSGGGATPTTAKPSSVTGGGTINVAPITASNGSTIMHEHTINITPRGPVNPTTTSSTFANSPSGGTMPTTVRTTTKPSTTNYPYNTNSKPSTTNYPYNTNSKPSTTNYPYNTNSVSNKTNY